MGESVVERRRDRAGEGVIVAESGSLYRKQFNRNVLTEGVKGRKPRGGWVSFPTLDKLRIEGNQRPVN